MAGLLFYSCGFVLFHRAARTMCSNFFVILFYKHSRRWKWIWLLQRCNILAAAATTSTPIPMFINHRNSVVGECYSDCIYSFHVGDVLFWFTLHQALYYCYCHTRDTVIDDRLCWLILGKCTRCRSDLNEMGHKLRLAEHEYILCGDRSMCTHDVKQLMMRIRVVRLFSFMKLHSRG